MNDIDKPQIICIGIGDTYPIIFTLENKNIKETLFTTFIWEMESITDCPEILSINEYDMVEQRTDSFLNLEYSQGLPLMIIFLIDFSEETNMKKLAHFIEETRCKFPHSHIVTMSLIPDNGKRAKALALNKKLLQLSDTRFTIDEKFIADKYPEHKEELLHRKSLSYMAIQAKELIEMTVETGMIDINWDDISDFIIPLETDCNQIQYFTASGNDVGETIDRLFDEIEKYCPDRCDAIIDIVESEDLFSFEDAQYLRMNNIFEGYIFGIRKSNKMKKGFVRINVFIRIS